MIVRLYLFQITMEHTESNSKLELILGELKQQRQQQSDVQSDLKDLKKKEMAKGEMNTDWS